MKSSDKSHKKHSDTAKKQIYVVMLIIQEWEQGDWFNLLSALPHLSLSLSLSFQFFPQSSLYSSPHTFLPLKRKERLLPNADFVAGLKSLSVNYRSMFLIVLEATWNKL